MNDDFRAFLYPGSPFLPGIDFGLLNPIVRDMFIKEEYFLDEAIAKGLGLVGDSSAFSTLARVGPENMAEYIKGFRRPFHLLLFVAMLQEVDISDIERAIPLLLAQKQLPEDQFLSPEDIAAAVPLMRADPHGITLINELVRKGLTSATNLYYRVGLEAARQTFLAYMDVLTILNPHPPQEEKQFRSLLFQLRSYKGNSHISAQAELQTVDTFSHPSAGTKDVKNSVPAPNSYTERNFVEDIQHIRILSSQMANGNGAAEQLLGIWEQLAGQQSLERYAALWTVVQIAFGDFAWQQFLSNGEKRVLSTARQAYSRPMKLSTVSKADLGTRFACALRLGTLYCEHGSDLEIPPFQLAEAVHDIYLDMLISNERLFQRSAYQFSKQKLQARNDLVAARILEACAYLGEQKREKSAQWYQEAFMVAEYSKSRMLREEMALAERHQPAGVPFELYDAEKRCLDRLREIYADVTARQDLRFFDPAFLNEFDAERGELRLKLEQIWVQMEGYGDEAHAYVLSRHDESLQWTGLQWDSFQQVANRLGQDFAVISMSRLPEAVQLMVLRADLEAPQMCVVPLPQHDLDHYLENYKSNILECWEYYDEKGFADRTNEWQALGEILFSPLEPFLNGVKYIYFLPYGHFHTLPLHALTLHGQPIIERWGVAYAPSISVLESTLSRPKREGSVLVMGYASSNNPKKEELTRIILEEALQVATYLRSPFLSPESAQAGTLRKQGQSAQLIHISCHGDMDKRDPLNSGIELADGMFTARHWLQLRLQADLVTLSACQTGISAIRPGDDLVGLTRAVLFAGASSLLTCLWSVDAPSTRDWMLDFYKRREDNSSQQQTPAKVLAFRDAVLELRKAYPDPYYWAPFILVGSYQ